MFCRNTVQWLYCLDYNFAWDSGLRVDRDHVCRDSDGKVRVILEAGGKITVMRGYAWNGCSPKICFLDLVIGTPDGAVYKITGRPKTYFASMVHDALYQFLGANSPVTRAQADRCFLRLMADSQFVLRVPYWLAVRLFGGLVWRGKKTLRKWRSEVAPVPLPYATPSAVQNVDAPDHPII